MKLFISELTEEYAKQLCTWRYNGVYSIYDFATWDIAIQQGWSITDKKARDADFRSAINEHEEFIGFFRMTKDTNGSIEIGLGLKPQYCGQGIGKDFVNLITQYIRAQYPNSKLFMEVRTFNTRAVKCYKECGYTIVLQHHMDFPWGSDDYFQMEYRDI